MENSAQLEARESSKRRSSRIVQAVPLSVTAVDALGRPFVERTSTIVVNCHGCRYQSKHYVLKNMWVTLEVPQWEGDRSPRQVRGRVTWVQRPVGVRELFQIGVEAPKYPATYGALHLRRPTGSPSLTSTGKK